LPTGASSFYRLKTAQPRVERRPEPFDLDLVARILVSGSDEAGALRSHVG
jgi:hypothetical protein